MWLRTATSSTGRPRLTASAARIRPQSTSFGFRLRQSAAVIIFTRTASAAPAEPASLNREAKPYQISQFLDMVREFGLND
jgi:hypothetical protein